MKATAFDAALDVGHKALYVASPTLARPIEVTTGSVNEAEEAAEHDDMAELRHEAQRQERTVIPNSRNVEVFYNRVRLHGALGYQSPVDFENKLN